MMKQSDVKTATALIIQGYLRANGDQMLPGKTEEPVADIENRELGRCLEAILIEVGDWAENLPEDHPVNAGTLKGIKPYDMAQEMVSCLGAEEARRVLDSAIEADLAAVIAAEEEAAKLADATVNAGEVDRKVRARTAALALIDLVGAEDAAAALAEAREYSDALR